METITKKDIVSIFEIIRISYEGAYMCKTKEDSKRLVDLWYDGLKDFPTPIVYQAVKNAIFSSEFAPKISTVLFEINKIISANDKTELELWHELEETFYPVYDEVLNIKYTSSPEQCYEKIVSIHNGLSDEIKAFVVSCNDLINLAKMFYESPDDIKYEKARFIKMSPSLKEKIRDRANAEKFLSLVGISKLSIGVGGGEQ